MMLEKLNLGDGHEALAPHVAQLIGMMSRMEDPVRKEQAGASGDMWNGYLRAHWEAQPDVIAEYEMWAYGFSLAPARELGDELVMRLWQLTPDYMLWGDFIDQNHEMKRNTVFEYLLWLVDEAARLRIGLDELEVALGTEWIC